MKILVVHPYKHHAIAVLNAIVKKFPESMGAFGYFFKDDVVDKMLSFIGYEEQIRGFEKEAVKKNVNTNILIKVLFLLASKNQRIKKVYERVFELWVLKKINKYDAVYVFHSYCSRVIQEAKMRRKLVIYDQICVFNRDRYFKSSITYSNTKEQLTNEIRNLQLADFIICPSEFVYKSLMGYDFSQQIISKLRRINYGADICRFKYMIKQISKEDNLRLLFVGNVRFEKGVSYLISAMQFLRDKNVSLTIVGASSEKEKELLNFIEQESNIHYLGKIPNSEMQRIYDENHVLVHPSLSEGSSLAVLEAMACGLPCIVTSSAGTIVRDKIDGLVIESKSSEAIRNAILFMLSDLKILPKMSKRSREQAERNTWAGFGDNIFRLFY